MKEFTDSRVLVVGGAGFVGSNLVRSILPSSPKSVVVVDNLLSAERENLPEAQELQFIEGSIADDAVLSQIEDRFDYVFHLATYHGNQSSIHDPLADHENNTLTSLKLFNHMSDFRQIKKVVYSSAGCTVAKKTYDDVEATDEEAPVSLYHDSPYQMSKIIGEFYANYYFMHYSLPVVKARFQNVYGPGEILGAGQWRGTPATVWRNVTPTFVYKALQHEALPVEGEGDASRDFIYVEDIVKGLMLCGTVGKAGDVYNLASGVETSILELATTINEISKNPTPIDFRPRRSWDRSGKRFGSPAKSREKLGFVASTSLAEGLKRTIDWAIENRSLIDATIAKHDEMMKTVA